MVGIKVHLSLGINDMFLILYIISSWNKVEIN